MGGSHYAYTEGQSDAQAERHFTPGAALCLLEMNGTKPVLRSLVEDPQGVIRDPDVSGDGRRILFAWKKSDRLDDYHLHELDLTSGKVRQLTFGLGFADYEGVYLPDGDLLFTSTRCVQTVDCFTTEVSNFYTCNPDGKYLRRVGFDQVHTNYPTVTQDGRVLYTRWEYNDRGQIFPQGLFQMNADGTGQTACYGNNSYFPTTILHARQIPGTTKVVAIASGHHTRQTGKLILVDPARGRQENQGVQLIAPVRDTPAVRIDQFGQEGALWQYPYPLSETDYLVTYNPWGWSQQPLLFGIYYMTSDGRRELLVSNPSISCNQAIPLHRPMPRLLPNTVAYTQRNGTYYVQDVHAGPGLAGIPRGQAGRLRVVALDFRAALLGGNGNHGEAGSAFVATPVAVSQGCWDPKIVLGETPICADGSAFFTVPARTPVYFQVLDAKGYVIQTMRSWSTLQPGENASCVGCHEHKNSAPLPRPVKEALKRGPKPLEPFHGPPRGFSFSREIQPILNRHCIGCHKDRGRLLYVSSSAAEKTPHRNSAKDTAFSLLDHETIDPKAKRRFSDGYLALTGSILAKNGTLEGVCRPLVNWTSPQSGPPMRTPYAAGAAKSTLLTLLEQGHKGVTLDCEELARLACWIDLVIPYCGDYTEAHAWTTQEKERYDHFLTKRKKMAAIEAHNIRELVAARGGDAGLVSADSRPDEAMTLRLEVVAADGSIVASRSGQARFSVPLVVEVPRRFRAGDRIRAAGAKYLAVQFDAHVGEALLFAPKGQLEMAVPLPPADVRTAPTPYPPAAFQAEQPRISIRPAALRELDAYRNVALNPYDVRSQATAYPHATASSEYGDEPVFAAPNAIDGHRLNRGHGGWPFQTWGPDRRKDLWWQVDFGREVQLDKVVLILRADVPHDRYWRQATLLFSDGQRQVIHLQKTAKPQTVSFRVRKTSSLKLIDLVQDAPLGWCALAAVETWGRDPVAVAEDLDRPAQD
jgi:hypothetical protein